MPRVPAPFVFGLGMLAGMAAIVVTISLSGCAALAQLGGLEVCVAAGRGASPGASGVPSASPTVLVVALPSAAPSAAPAGQ